MTLKAVLDSDQFGELDEATRSLYAEHEGRYVLNIEGADDLPAVRALKTGHSRSKQERDEAKAAAAALKKRLGRLAEEEDLDLSDADEERLERALKLLKGEGEDPGQKQGDGAKGPDLEKIKQLARKPLERDLAAAVERADAAEAKLQKLVVNSALSEAVAEIKVHGPFVQAVKAMFRDKVKLGQDDAGEPVAMIEGEYGEQPVAKYLKEWSQTDEGKAFILAPENGGGGARGGAIGKVKNPWAPDNWNMSEQGRIYLEDPERAKRMAAEHGRRVGA